MFNDKVKEKKIQNKWRTLAETASTEDQEAVGRVWLTTMVGITVEEVKKFLAGDPETEEKVVGLVHAGTTMVEAKEKLKRIAKFWEKINKIFPDLHTEDEKDFILKEGKESGPVTFIIYFCNRGIGTYPVIPKSKLIKEISTNMHVYK